MNESRAAVRYAKAALEYAIETNATQSVDADMRYIMDSLKKNPELQEVLESPVIMSNQKKDVLLSVFDQSEEITKNLIGLLVKNKRIAFLGEVASKFIYLNDLMKGEKIAEVTTTIPLTAKLEEEILGQIEKLTDNKVVLKNKIDKDIIGGFILRIGDIQFNASIANQLNSLKREFTNS